MTDFSRYFPDGGGQGDFSQYFPPAPERQAAPKATGPSAEDIAFADPTRGMSLFELARAGAGKFFSDVGRGARQIFDSPSPTLSGLVTGDQRTPLQREIDESKKLDAPLMKTGAGIAGNIVGGMTAALPALAIPGVNTYTGAAVLGGLQGALQPVETGGSRALNTGVGAGAGVVGQGVGNMIGRAIRPIQPVVDAERQRLAALAATQGIPLSIGQQTGSRPMQVTESVLENLPFSSGPALAAKQTQSDAYNTAVLGTAGINANRATPTVLAGQKSAVGGELGNIAGRNSLDFNTTLINRLPQIAADARTRLTPNAATEVEGTIDRILSQVDQTGSMLGTNYQGWREPLRAMNDGSAQGRYYGQIRAALDDAFRAQLPGQEGQRFRELSQQYGNVKTIADAMGGAGAGTKIGNISPAQLESSLTKNVGREGKALGRGGPLNDLVGVGRQFISESVPNSGTAQRQMIQSLLTTSGGTGLGAGVAAASGNDPLQGAMLGAGATGAGLMVPRVVQSILGSEAARRYFTQGIVALTPQERAALSAATTAFAPSGIAAMMSQ